MAVTIYQALDYSDKLVRAVEEGVFPYLKDPFLSSQLYINKIHKAGFLEFIEEELYSILSKMSINGVLKDVIEIYVLDSGSWRQVVPSKIVINGEWKDIKTLGTYDGG